MFLSITGILVIVSFMVPRWERSSIKRYLHLEAVYHFVALVFWFTAATAVAGMVPFVCGRVWVYPLTHALYCVRLASAKTSFGARVIASSHPVRLCLLCM